MPRPTSKKRRGQRYTAPISKQVEARLEGVTNEMALEAAEARFAADSAGKPALAELAEFARREQMRQFEFVSKVDAALREGASWADLAVLFDVAVPTLRQRHRRTTRCLEIRYGTSAEA